MREEGCVFKSPFPNRDTNVASRREKWNLPAKFGAFYELG